MSHWIKHESLKGDIQNGDRVRRITGAKTEGNVVDASEYAVLITFEGGHGAQPTTVRVNRHNLEVKIQ